MKDPEEAQQDQFTGINYDSFSEFLMYDMLEVPKWSEKGKKKVVENISISRNYRVYKRQMRKMFSHMHELRVKNVARRKKELSKHSTAEKIKLRNIRRQKL